VTGHVPLSGDSELCHSTVGSKIGHHVEQYSLSLVDIPSSTWSVNKDGGKVLQMHDVM
jgi:hypothetical protein